MVDSYLLPWTGTTYRHTSPQADRNVLGFRFTGMNADNRWNGPGEPTLYLAGDPGIMIAEWGRHFPSVFDEGLLPVAVERSVFGLWLRWQYVVDLRNPAAVRHVDASSWFLDRNLARVVARQMRRPSPSSPCRPGSRGRALAGRWLREPGRRMPGLTRRSRRPMVYQYSRSTAAMAVDSCVVGR